MSDREREPAWNGEGFDPWLPSRLRASAQIAAAERQVYESFWSYLSEFLVAALRAVLASQVPDPQNVRGVEDRWHAAMADFVATAIRAVIESVFQGIFGPDVQFDSRPAVVAYLAQVENRMRDVDNEVYTRVAAAVAQGTQEGWSIPQTAEALSELLDSDNPLWRNKATVVARTETIGALNAGRTDSFNAIAAEVPELNFQQQWLATDDNRTRPTHRAADGQRIAIGARFQVGSSELRFPGDPLGPADETIQCRCTTILVEEGREVDFTNRGFRGIL
jgi:outer membrane murein-binding lipoprotein Lpp